MKVVGVFVRFSRRFTHSAPVVLTCSGSNQSEPPLKARREEPLWSPLSDDGRLIGLKVRRSVRDLSRNVTTGVSSLLVSGDTKQ
jgi:hypothetical protein